MRRIWPNALLRRVLARDWSTIRAAIWATRSVFRLRRHLRVSHEPVELPRVPPVGPDASKGVTAVLDRLDASCLVSSVVRQHWLAAHGQPRDVVIGVTGVEDFEAHAWLEGDAEHPDTSFVEIHRWRPQTPPTAPGNAG